MKTKKIIFILLLPLILEIVVSCCECIEPIYQKYTNKALSINNLDNSGREPIVSTSTSIIKTAYGIRIQLLGEKIAGIERPNSIFIQSAFAFTKCNCPPSYQFLPKDSITTIKILSLNDFNSTHSANSEISDYFKVYKYYSFSTIQDYIRNTNPVLNYESDLAIKIDLLLMTAPTINNQHKFRVQITLSDGRVLEQDTSIIELI